MSGRVVHVNDHVPDAVYVGRANNAHRLAASPLANPYRVEQYGRSGAIVRYTGMLHALVAGGHEHIITALIEARDKPLACWCRRDGEVKTDRNACHADAILTILGMFTNEQLRAKIAR